MFGLWCNGSTTGFGSVCPSSNLGSPTTNPQKALRNNILGLSCFGRAHYRTQNNDTI